MCNIKFMKKYGNIDKDTTTILYTYDEIKSSLTYQQRKDAEYMINNERVRSRFPIAGWIIFEDIYKPLFERDENRFWMVI